MSTPSIKKESKVQPVYNTSDVKVKVKSENSHSAAGPSAARPINNKKKKTKKKKKSKSSSYLTSKQKAKAVLAPNTPKDFKLPSDEQLRETPAYSEYRKYVGSKRALWQTRKKVIADAIRTLHPGYETNAEKQWRTYLEDRAKQARAAEDHTDLSEPPPTRSQAQAQGPIRVMSGAAQRSPRKAALAAQQSIREKLEELERPMMIEDSPSPSTRHGSSESPEPIEFRPPQPARSRIPPVDAPTTLAHNTIQDPQPPVAVRVSQPSPVSGAGPSLLLPRDDASVTAPISRTIEATSVQPVPEAGPSASVPQTSALRTQSDTTTMAPSNTQAGPSSSRIYETDYPSGGDSYDKDGYGVFVDPESEDGLEIWVDPMIPGRIDMIKAIQDEGGTISAFHTEETTHLIILSPGSTYIFDMYCHPEWLSMKRKELIAKRHARSRKRKRTEAPLSETAVNQEGEWQHNVLLKSGWVEKCIEVGRFLGSADRWGGFRAGGPPPGTRTSSDDITGDDGTPPDVAHPNGDETQPIEINGSTRQNIDDNENPSVQLADRDVSMDMCMDIDMDINMEEGGPEPTATAILDPEDAFTTTIESVHDPAPEPEMISLEGLVSSPPPDPDTTIQPGQARDIAEMDVDYQPEEDNDDDDYQEEDDSAYSLEKLPSTGQRGGFSLQGKAAAAARARWNKARPEGAQKKENVSGHGSANKRNLAISRQANNAAEHINEQPVVDFEEIYLNDAFIHGRAEKGLGALPRSQDGENTVNEASVMVPEPVMSNDEAGQMTQGIVALPQELSIPDEGMEDSSLPDGIAPPDENVEATKEIDATKVATVEVDEPPVDPSIMFSSCTFWVDTSYPDRSTLTRKLKAAGGSLCSEYSESTHVLIHNYKPTQWSGIVEGIVRDGIWFLHILWAIRSFEAGRKLQEEEFAVPGGNPLTDNVDDNKPPSSQLQGGKTHRSDGTMEPFLSSEKLAEIFEKESSILQEGKTLKFLSELLMKKYKTYKASHWMNLFNDWRKNQGRFAYLVAGPSHPRPTPTLKSTPAPDGGRRSQASSQSRSKSPIKIAVKAADGKSAFNVEKVMSEVSEAIKGGQERKPALKEAVKKYGGYSYPILKKLFRNYRKKTGPFAVNPVDREPLPEQDRPLVSHSADAHLPSTLKKSGATSCSRAGSASVAGPSTSSRQTSSEARSTSNHAGKAPYMTSEKIAKAFAKRFELILTKNITSFDVGCIMQREFPGYSTGTWSTMYLDWKNGRGKKFSHLGRYAFVPPEQLARMDTALPPVEGERPTKKPRNMNNQYVHGYTDEEDRAMAAYLVGKPEIGRKMPKFWQEFQKQYPARTASGYCQHYTVFKWKIDEYVKKLEEESKVDMIPGGSAPRTQTSTRHNGIQGSSQEDPVFVHSDIDEDDGIISMSHSPIGSKSEVTSMKSHSQNAADDELIELAKKDKGLTEEEQADLEVGLALMAKGDDGDDDVVYVPSDESDTTESENYE